MKKKAMKKVVTHDSIVGSLVTVIDQLDAHKNSQDAVVATNKQVITKLEEQNAVATDEAARSVATSANLKTLIGK